MLQERIENNSRRRKIREGETDLFVPLEEEPAKYPSFFNPQGKFVRDVSMVCYKAYAKSLSQNSLTFADPLCGTGARGLRVANEVANVKRVFLNDVSSVSLDFARASAELNGIESKCFFSRQEACTFLSARSENLGERFDIVDIDPFGTPSPFVDCALRSVKHGGLLSIAATDSAVLCGVYPKVAQRKYQGLPLRTDYSHEIGLRLLFGLLAQTAMRMEAGIDPLFSHHDRHYFRVYARICVGNNYSVQNQREMGFVRHCFKCGFRKVELFAGESTFACPECANQVLRAGGPLWAGKIQDGEFVESCAKISDFSLFQQELDIPLYYDLSSICDEMGTRTPKMDDVLEEIRTREGGRFRASRTRLNPTGIRTDLPIQDLRKIVEGLVR